MATKTLIYKLARFNDETKGSSLQDLLTKALKARIAAFARRQSTEHEGQFRLINFHGVYKGARVGEMFDYTVGHQQPTAEFSETAERLELSSISPPSEKSEFLHSIMYFGVRENTVILAQSASLRASQFESYINWLLQDNGFIAESDYVKLCDRPILEKSKIRAKTKSIEIKSPVDFGISSESRDPDEVKRDTQSLVIRSSTVAWETLKKILPPEISLSDGLSAQDIVRDGSLEVRLLLKWSSPTKKDDQLEFLDVVSDKLRHVESEIDYIINTSSGTISRDDIKLKKQVSVPTNSSGLIRRDEMWERIIAWLDELISDNKIIVEK